MEPRIPQSTKPPEFLWKLNKNPDAFDELDERSPYSKKLNSDLERSVMLKDSKPRETNSNSNNNPISSTEQPNLDEKDLQFFWKYNKDPWDPNEEEQWSPYDLEDQCILSDAYKEYIKDKSQDAVNLNSSSDYYINLSHMVQISKKNKNNQRPVIRCHPNNVTNIVRPHRFDTAKYHANDIHTQVQIKILHQKQIKDDYEPSPVLNKTESKKKEKKIIFFNVFNGYPIKLEIDQKLCFFKDKYEIRITLEELKTILEHEIQSLEPQFVVVDSFTSYQTEIQQIWNATSFFTTIVQLYSIEGYLYKKLNEYLRTFDSKNFFKIKYYYICLLASFSYYSQTNIFPKPNPNGDIILYRGSNFSHNEHQEFIKKGSKIQVFYDFLLTSIGEQSVHKSFFNKNSTNKQYLWKIKIPSYLIINESYNFAQIPSISRYEGQEVVLLKSGAVISIDHIIPYSENICGQIEFYPNKFINICSLKSFSLSSFFKLISLDFSITTLNLANNGLGYDEKNMMTLKEILFKNTSITTLNLANNELGYNEKNMMHLKEILFQNTSITSLNLAYNGLGYNEKNMMYLKEAFFHNISITKLNLAYNGLGYNERGILHIKEVLFNNHSIRKLNLKWNELGENEKSIFNWVVSLRKNSVKIEIKF